MKTETVYTLGSVRHLEIINPFPPSRSHRHGVVVFNHLTKTYQWLSQDKSKEVFEAVSLEVSPAALKAMKIVMNAGA
jgi:hypothetical protein